MSHRHYALNTCCPGMPGVLMQSQMRSDLITQSTDGHNGYWSFSLTRLNWHMAMLAAARGGAFIVDATRRGKTFPASDLVEAA